MMNGLCLADAVIAVNGEGAQATVRVFRHLDPQADLYDYTWGASSPFWRDDATARMGMLFEAVMFMQRTLRIPLDQVVESLRVIPECDAVFGD
jgi:hypothetical protein